MQVELFERNLGKFVDGEGQAAGRRVRADIEATILALMPKPLATMNSRYWSPGVGSPM